MFEISYNNVVKRKSVKFHTPYHPGWNTHKVYIVYFWEVKVKIIFYGIHFIWNFNVLFNHISDVTANAKGYVKMLI